jgi:predicted dehydrogenase
MISWYHLTAWRKLGGRVELVAVCDLDAGKAQDRAQEFGIAKVYTDREAMLAGETIHALDVASPRETHAGWVEAAAERGIDVLCQKPLTPTLAEAQELVLRLEGKIRLMVHENWRFRPWYRELKSWIAAGLLGDIVLGRIAMVNSGFLPDAAGKRPAFVRQPFMQHEKRLMMAEVLIHHLDAMRMSRARRWPRYFSRRRPARRSRSQARWRRQAIRHECPIGSK